MLVTVTGYKYRLIINQSTFTYLIQTAWGLHCYCSYSIGGTHRIRGFPRSYRYSNPDIPALTSMLWMSKLYHASKFRFIQYVGICNKVLLLYLSDHSMIKFQNSLLVLVCLFSFLCEHLSQFCLDSTLNCGEVKFNPRVQTAPWSISLGLLRLKGWRRSNVRTS